MIVSQSSLVTKAIKICRDVLIDENLQLSKGQKEAYAKFNASNGWITRFKTRYKICSRFVTTKCSKPVSEIEASLKAYFSDLNSTLDNEKPAVIYNMDETSIWVELSSNHTLERKGQKSHMPTCRRWYWRYYKGQDKILFSIMVIRQLGE